MRRFLAALVLSLFLVSVASAACVDNGVCSPDEVTLGCADCTFGVDDSVCVDDGACTYAEKQAGCDDCRAKRVLVEETDEEDEPATVPMTGFVTMGASALAVLFGFFVIVAIAVAAMKLSQRQDRRRIRL
jgi:hypothetical protein